MQLFTLSTFKIKGGYHMKYKINRNILHLLSISIITLCCVGIISAQEPTKSTESTDKNKELEAKALLMLYSIIGDAESLKLPENQAKALATVSDLLWSIDETKARELMNEAQNKFLTLLTQHDSENHSGIDAIIPGKIVELRRHILQAIAEHDFEQALNFMTSTKTIIEKMPGYQKSNEQIIEGDVLRYIPDSNPKRGLQLAKEHISSTDNMSNIFNTIYSLHNKDRDAANELIDITINKSKSNTQNSSQTLFLLGSLLQSAPPPDSHSTTSGDARYMTTRKQAKEISELYIKIVQAQLSSIKSNNGDNPSHFASSVSNNLNNVSKYIEAYTPESKEALKNIKSELDNIMSLVNPQQKRWNEFNETSNNNSAEKLIELGKNAPPAMQNSYYERAIHKILNDGNFELARKVANENIKDSGQLTRTLSNIEFRQMDKQVKEKKFDIALSSVKNMHNVSDKIRAFVQIARQAQSVRDTVMAEAMLNEAYSLINGPPKSTMEFQNQLMIAREFQSINISQSFEIINLTIDKLNELLDASVLIMEFERRGTVRKGELVGVSSGDLSYFNQLLESFASFFKSDPDRTESILNNIKRIDARIIIKLALLEQFFTGKNTSNRSIRVTRSVIK